MEFGISFFPNVGPEEKSGADYWREALELVDMCDELGYSHVRTVEHYFHPYGGYSPNPLIFLAAASQRLSTPGGAVSTPDSALCSLRACRPSTMPSSPVLE